MKRGWNPTRKAEEAKRREPDMNSEALEYVNTGIEVLQVPYHDFKYMVMKLEKSRLRGTDVEDAIRMAYSVLSNRFYLLTDLRKRIEKDIAHPPNWEEEAQKLLDYQNSLVPEDLFEDKPKEAPGDDLRDIFG